MFHNKISLKINVILLLVALSLPFYGVCAKNKSYYSGDGISYQDKIIIGSVNMGYCQIFQYENGKINEKARIKSLDDVVLGRGAFADLLFSEEGGGLYLYLIGGRYIYKYDLADLANPKLIKQVQDSGWDWYFGLEKSGNKIISKGAKEIKIWNNNLDNVDSFKVPNYYYNNLGFDYDHGYFVRTDDRVLSLYDIKTRKQISSIAIDVDSKNQRRIYMDVASKNIYLVGNQSLKKINYANGLKLEKEFKHISDVGYDVSELDGDNNLYFSDGYGVVKVDQKYLLPVDWVYTTQIASGGGWAMGLRFLPDSAGGKILVFNNNNIILLDKDLNLKASLSSTEIEDRSLPEGNLKLRLNPDHGSIGSTVTLSGGGYGPGEDLIIFFGDKDKMYAQADSKGNFSANIIIPSVKLKKFDIKVVGQVTKLSYSISFDII